MQSDSLLRIKRERDNCVQSRFLSKSAVLLLQTVFIKQYTALVIAAGGEIYFFRSKRYKYINEVHQLDDTNFKEKRGL